MTVHHMTNRNHQACIRLSSDIGYRLRQAERILQGLRTTVQAEHVLRPVKAALENVEECRKLLEELYTRMEVVE